MAEASKEGLDCKTLYLKVSIHCEGCKKKVKRVLQSMPEVHKVEIDSVQHKVAVTCNTGHEKLIRKLQKSHKQASVWPEAKKPGGNQAPNTSSADKNQNNESNSKPKDNEPKESSEKPKEIQPEQAKEKSSDKGAEKEEIEKEKPKADDETKSKPQEKEKEKEKEKDVVKEKPKEKEEKTKEQSEKEANNEGKKEKKEEEEKKIESSDKVEVQHVERGISPPQPYQDFMNPYLYPYPPQPIMSYHTAQPSSSQAFYQQPPMPGTQGYMHPHQNPYPSYPYPYQHPYGAPNDFGYGTTESSTRGDHNDTLNYFNEENANSCSVM